jgi:glycosyltransferase involved in cell wall biosynthesis
MRIVVIGGWAPSLIKFRGPLLAAMVARGHEVIAMAPDGTASLRQQLATEGVAFEEIEIDRAGMNPRADLRTLRALARRLRALRPDLVFAYTIKPLLYGIIAARIAGVPHRVAMITGLGYAFTPQRTVRGRMVGAIASRMYRRVLRQCEVVFLQNPDDRDDLTRRGILPANARVELVRGSGVDVDHYAMSPLPPYPVTFLFIGRLLRDKGIFEYCAAAMEIRRVRRDVRFQMLGWLDPNPESATAADLAAWTTSGIEYLGVADDVRPHLAASHVLVLPSYREGTPRSVLEAMSMGRAVITTDAPGCRETVVNEDSGLVVPPRDAGALSAAMLRLIDEPETLRRIAVAARVRVEQLYDARTVAAKMLAMMGL